MGKKIIIFVVLVILFISITVILRNSRKNYEPGDYEFSLRHDGLKRTYLVHLPSLYSEKKELPVVFVIHGGGGNAQSMKDYVLMDKLADKEGFIVVYPEGTGKKAFGNLIASWDAGRCCTPGEVDDVGFFRKMIDDLDDKFSVDSKRVYATGLSNGAGMSYRLACELSDQIAAIAPVSTVGDIENCKPTRFVPTLHIHGDADPCAPYQGGLTGGGCTKEFLKAYLNVDYQAPLIEVDPVLSFIEKWKKLNNVPEASQTRSLANDVTCSTSENEKGEVTLCTINGGGHMWPGESYGNPCKNGMDTRLCVTYRAVLGNKSDWYANQYIWEFFEKYSLS